MTTMTADTDASTSILRMEFPQLIHALEATLAELGEALLEERDYPTRGGPAHANNDEVLRTIRQEAVAVIRAIDYQDEQDPHTTRIYPGIFGASRQTLALAQESNRLRAELHRVMQAMDGVIVEVEDLDTHLPVRRPLLKVASAASGHARLHRRQTTRQLVILDQMPEVASFTWARTRKILRQSHDQVVEALMRLRSKAANPGQIGLVDADLDLMASLPVTEPYALVKPPHGHPRVNINFDRTEINRRGQFVALLPILYPAAAGDRPPVGSPLMAEEHAPRPRLPRSDKTVGDHPFLKTLPIHRYGAPSRTPGQVTE